MNKQINKLRQSLLLATIATFMVLGASGAVFAQKADKYPKPDFSAMEEYWEIVEWEYDFTSGVPRFIVTAKPKQKVVPRWFDVTWRDAKGVMLLKHTLMFNSATLSQIKVGEPMRGSCPAPWKVQMGQVKSIMITENPEGGDGNTAN